MAIREGNSRPLPCNPLQSNPWALALPTYAEAAALVAGHAARLRRSRPAVERASLSAAAGRVLAQPLCADRDQPPFTRSTRDGFACRAAEASMHTPLNLVGSTRAGEAPAGPLPNGAAWEIMTGAPVPRSANAVMMLEHVQIVGKKVLLLPPRKLKKGENIVAQGAQAREGDELLSAGTAIHSAQIALAATCGYASAESLLASPRGHSRHRRRIGLVHPRPHPVRSAIQTPPCWPRW